MEKNNTSAGLADISELEIGLLADEWKTKYPIPDVNLVQKLCQDLEDILGDTLLTGRSKDQLLLKFGRRLESEIFGGKELTDPALSTNKSEATVRSLDSHSRMRNPG